MLTTRKKSIKFRFLLTIFTLLAWNCLMRPVSLTFLWKFLRSAKLSKIQCNRKILRSQMIPARTVIVGANGSTTMTLHSSEREHVRVSARIVMQQKRRWQKEQRDGMNLCAVKIATG